MSVASLMMCLRMLAEVAFFFSMAHKVTRALVSVSDKTGLTDLCRFLTETYKAQPRLSRALTDAHSD